MEREKKELTAEQLDTATGGFNPADVGPKLPKFICVDCYFSTYDIEVFKNHRNQCQGIRRGI